MARNSQSPASDGARRGAWTVLNNATPIESPDSPQASAAATAEFERELTEAISAAIVQASADNLRTKDLASALLSVLAVTLAMSPAARSPTTLRRTVEHLTKLLRRRVVAVLASESLGGRA